MAWGNKTAKKQAKATETETAAKPVIAVEYNGALYPSFQSAEAARAKADLLSLLVPPRDFNSYHMYGGMIDSGRKEAVAAVMQNAERVRTILTKYLDAANIEMPTNVSG